MVEFKEQCAEIWAGSEVQAESFTRIRRRMITDCCKWDAQVGDVSTLAAFPMVMEEGTWRRLEMWAEKLAAEALEAEERILWREDLMRLTGMPRALRGALADGAAVRALPAGVRTMRFDFHWTTEGWRISEVNADVPGGFTEGSHFSGMMAEAAGGTAGQTPALHTAGDPLERWADGVARQSEGGVAALLAAAGFMEDQQIMACLRGALAERGFAGVICGPGNLRWENGEAWLGTARVRTVVRFYQGEWLAELPRRTGWRNLFAGSSVPVSNAGRAVVMESKRFALAWERLGMKMETWRELLPETRDPREVDWRNDVGWVLKSAYCNTGDTVMMRGVTEEAAWRKMARAVWWNPGDWVAQRRFESVAVETPRGMMVPCVGVYVIDGKAAGAYVRLSGSQVVAYEAMDAALLIERKGEF